jgi:hypothetical protein
VSIGTYIYTTDATSVCEVMFASPSGTQDTIRSFHTDFNFACFNLGILSLLVARTCLDSEYNL